MHYQLLKQKIGILDDYEPFRLEGDLHLTFENVAGFTEPMTAKIVSSAPYFCHVQDGGAVFSKKNLKGKVGVCLICKEGTIACTGFTALENGEGKLWIQPDVSDIVKRLKRAEKELSNCLADIEDLSKKYNGLASRIEKLFAGYNY